MKALIRAVTDAGLKRALAFFLRRWIDPYLLRGLSSKQVTVESGEGRAKLLNIKLDCSLLTSMFASITNHVRFVCFEVREFELELHASTRKGIVLRARGVSISLDFTSSQEAPKPSAPHSDSASGSSTPAHSQAPNSCLVQALIDRLALGGINLIIEDARVTLVPQAPAGPKCESAVLSQELTLELQQMRMHVAAPQGESDSTGNLNVALSSVIASPRARWQLKVSEAHIFVGQYELVSARALNLSLSTCGDVAETVSSDAFGRMRCGPAAIPGAVISSPIETEICITIQLLKTSLTIGALAALVAANRFPSSQPNPEEHRTDTAEDQAGGESLEIHAKAGHDVCEKEDISVASISDGSGDSFYSTVSQAPESSFVAATTVSSKGTLLVHTSIDCFELDWEIEPSHALRLCAGVVAADVAVLKSAAIFSLSSRSLRLLESHATVASAKGMRSTELAPILTFSTQAGVPDATLTALRLSREPASVSLSTAPAQLSINAPTIALLQKNCCASGGASNTHDNNSIVGTMCIECISVEVTVNDKYCAQFAPVLHVISEELNVCWEIPRDALIKMASISILGPKRRACAPLVELRGTAGLNPIIARLSSDAIVTISCASCAANLDLLLDDSDETKIWHERLQALICSVKTDESSATADSEIAASITSEHMLFCWNSLHLAVDQSVLYVQIGPYDTTTVNLSADTPTLELRHSSIMPLWRPLTRLEYAQVERKPSTEAAHLDMKWSNNIDFSSLVICLTNIVLFSPTLATAVASLSSSASSDTSSSNSSGGGSGSSSSSSSSSKSLCLQLQAAYVLVDIGQGILLGLQSISANSSDISGGAHGSSTYLNLGKANIYVQHCSLRQGEAVLVGTFSAASMELTKSSADEEDTQVDMSEDTDVLSDYKLDANVDSLYVMGCLDALLVLSASILALGGSGKSSPSQARQRGNPAFREKLLQNSIKPGPELNQYSLQDSLLVNGLTDTLSLDLAHSVQLPARWLPAYATDTGNGSDGKSSDDGFVSWSDDDSAGADNSDDNINCQDACDVQHFERDAQLMTKEALQHFEEMELAELPPRARPHASGYLSTGSTCIKHSEFVCTSEDASLYGSKNRTTVGKSHDAWARNARNSAIDLGAGRWLLPLEKIPLFPLHFTVPKSKGLPLEQQIPSHAAPTKAELELPVRMRLVFKTNFRLCLQSGNSGVVGRSNEASENAILRLDAVITVAQQLYDRWVHNEGPDSDSEDQLHSRTTVCLGCLLIVLEPPAKDGVPRRVAGPWRARTTITDALSSMRISLLTKRLIDGNLEHAVAVQLQPMRLYIDGPLLEFIIALPSDPNCGSSSSSRISSVSVAGFSLKVDHSASLPSLPDLHLHSRGRQRSICTALLPLLRLFPVEGLVLAFPLVEVQGSAVDACGGGLLGAVAAVSIEWISLIPTILTASYPVSITSVGGSLNSLFSSDDSSASLMHRHLLSAARDVSGGVLHVSHRLALGTAHVLRLVVGAPEKPKDRLQTTQPRTFGQGVTRGMSALNSQLKDAAVPIYEASRQNSRAHVDAFDKAVAIAAAVPQTLILPVAGSIEALGLLLQGMRNSISPARAVEEEDRYKCNVSVYPFNPET